MVPLLATPALLLNAAVYSTTRGQLKKLAEDPDVKYVSPDREVKGTLDYAAPTLGADIARSDGWDGTGIGVAVIDSGVCPDADLDVKNSNLRDPSDSLFFVCNVPLGWRFHNSFGVKCSSRQERRQSEQRHN